MDLTPQEAQAKTVTVKQACELVGVCRRTLYSWMDAGKVVFIRTAGGTRRIVTASLWKPGNEKAS